MPELNSTDIDRWFDRLWSNYRLSLTHEADQFLAQLHDEVAAGRALGNQCVCGCVTEPPDRDS
jgi:hypothetical protein